MTAEKKCNNKYCKSECKHKVDLKSLNKSKDARKKIVEGNKIVKK
jgi:hypothetical protein